MERPRGVNFIYSGGGDPLCTVHYIEEKDSTARFATGDMRDSRLKSKSGRHQPQRRDCTLYSRGPL